MHLNSNFKELREVFTLLNASLGPTQCSFSQITIAYLVVVPRPLLYPLYLHRHQNCMMSKIRMQSCFSPLTPPLIDLLLEILEMTIHQNPTTTDRIAASILLSEFGYHLCHFSQSFPATIQFGAKLCLLNNQGASCHGASLSDSPHDLSRLRLIAFLNYLRLRYLKKKSSQTLRPLHCVLNYVTTCLRCLLALPQHQIDLCQYPQFIFQI